jgi:hypothetical protein
LDQNRKRISVQAYSPCAAKRGSGCFLGQDPFKKLARDSHPFPESLSWIIVA